MIRVFGGLLLVSALVIGVAGSADAQTVIESTFDGRLSAGQNAWREASNWSPQQVPDNSASTSFNVTIASAASVSESYTVSNVRLAPPYGSWK